jgi:replication factor C subunit 1
MANELGFVELVCLDTRGHSIALRSCLFPGIGKTTLANLIAQQCHFEVRPRRVCACYCVLSVLHSRESYGQQVLEFNASDTRSKRAITEQVADVVVNTAMDGIGGTKKRIVIMDEGIDSKGRLQVNEVFYSLFPGHHHHPKIRPYDIVDGMGGSDRGGIQELIKVIKISKTPIICICNDRQCQKIKSLANHCYDVRVKRPTKQQISKRMIEIGRLEGLTIESNAAEILVEQVGNDIRQVLHAMQMWRAQSTTMTFSSVKNGMQRIEKDKVTRHA